MGILFTEKNIVHCKECGEMKLLFLYFIAPATVSFLVQSILCRKVKKGILRHSALILPIISIAFGVTTLLTQSNDIFGGLGVVAAVFWFANAICTALGYGAAWLIFLISKKRKNWDQDL